jgi:hypothetical protein
MFYLLGASPGTWQRETAGVFPTLRKNAPAAYTDDRLPWNELTGGSWQLTEVTDNRFCLTHYFMTPDVEHPIIGIQGQAEYLTAIAARAGAETEMNALVLAGLPVPEMHPLASVIWQTKDSYGNAISAKIIQTADGANWVDWRQASVTPGAGVSSPTDPNAIHDNVAAEFAAIASATITASDVILFEDADDSDNKKQDTVQGIIDLAGESWERRSRYAEGWASPSGPATMQGGGCINILVTEVDNVSSFDTDTDGPALRQVCLGVTGNRAYCSTGAVVGESQCDPEVVIPIKLSDASNVRAFIGLSSLSNQNNVASDDVAADMVGVQFCKGPGTRGDTFFQFVEDDGATQNLTASTVTPAINTLYRVRIKYSSNGASCAVSIEDNAGTVLDSATLSTNLPTTTQPLYIFCGIECRNNNPAEIWQYQWRMRIYGAQT